MNWRLFHERLQLATSRGGPSAVLFGAARLLLRLDVYKILTIDLRVPAELSGTPPLPPDVRFLRILGPDDFLSCSLSIQAQLDDGSGWGVRPVLANGGRLYALIASDEVLSQVTIDTRTARVDTPTRLSISFAPRESFLSFLVTSAAARRQGWAGRVLRLVMADLRQEGFKACHCHVQATNVRSLRTFASRGWRRTGWLLTTTSARFLGSFGRALSILPSRGG